VGAVHLARAGDAPPLRRRHDAAVRDLQHRRHARRLAWRAARASGLIAALATRLPARCGSRTRCSLAAHAGGRTRRGTRGRAVAFAPNLASAIALLLARFLLSQADVPTRQAYVMGVVEPSERTAAAAYTNTARYLTRPVAPLIAGATLRGALGAPFLIAGALK